MSRQLSLDVAKQHDGSFKHGASSPDSFVLLLVSVFPYVASSHVNLLEQQKVFSYIRKELNSHRIGTPTCPFHYLETVMSLSNDGDAKDDGWKKWS